MKRKTVFTDTRLTKEAQRQLEVLGFYVVTLPPFSKLPPAVASHTDMLLFKIDDVIFSHADYVNEAPWVFDEIYDCGIKKIHLTDDEILPQYPFDARLNIIVFGKKVFCKTDTVSKSVLNYLHTHGYEIINVRQGYPACTVLKLNGNAAITSDRGMAEALLKHGINVTVIEKGGIELPPYEYGFIGGAGGVYDGKVYFTGSIDKHPSEDAILKAIEKEGLIPVYLTRTLPFDLGGLLFTD